LPEERGVIGLLVSVRAFLSVLEVRVAVLFSVRVQNLRALGDGGKGKPFRVFSLLRCAPVIACGLTPPA